MRKILSFLFVFLIFALPTQAKVVLDLNRGQVQPLPIAIPSFYGDSAQNDSVANSGTKNKNARVKSIFFMIKKYTS